MLQERLENDQSQAVNHYVIEQQLRNRKFLHEAMRRSLKKTIASADNTHCLETPVEYNITDSMLNKEAGFFISNLPILLRAPGKHPYRKLSSFWTPPPPLSSEGALRGGAGGGMDIFWNYTFTIRQSSGKQVQTETF